MSKEYPKPTPTAMPEALAQILEAFDIEASKVAVIGWLEIQGYKVVKAEEDATEDLVKAATIVASYANEDPDQFDDGILSKQFERDLKHLLEVVSKATGKEGATT